MGLLAGLLLLLVALATAEALSPAFVPDRPASGRLPTNFAFGLINWGLAAFLPLSSVAAAGAAREMEFGLFNVVAVPTAMVFLLTFALRSLLAYLLHRLFHAVPPLWRVHRVHHADTELDLSTAFRSHPGELFIVAATASSVAFLLGLPPEALLAYELAAVAAVLASHSNIRLPRRSDLLLRRLFVTPEMHRVHHSSRRAETDSNFGELLSVWDRLFGTYRLLPSEHLSEMRIGLGDGFDEDAASFPRQLLLRCERRRT